MYKVKHIMFWTSSDAPEVEDYFFKTKKNAEKLVEAFKEYYGKEVADTHKGGCIYPIESDSVSRRIVRIEKVEANDDCIDEMCSQVKRIGSTL